MRSMSHLGMFLFKTSGDTINNVVRYEKHAFPNQPKNWHSGDLALISKNASDCRKYRGKRIEKQIQFIAELINIRSLIPGESDRYWPGENNNWKYLVELGNMHKLSQFFDLRDVIRNFRRYGPPESFAKIDSIDEATIRRHLISNGDLIT